MTAQRHARLNQLLQDLPEGYLADVEWLKSRGLSPSSIRDYAKGGWLEHVASRLYRRPGAALPGKAPVQWELCLLSLQNVMGLEVHAGAQTALELAGYWQYATFGRRRVWVYTDDRRARAILSRAPLDAELELRTGRLFTEPDLGLERRVLDLATSSLGAAAGPGQAPPAARKQLLTVSSLERAILEMLAEVPGEVSFEHGGELFEGLTTLRPGLMKELLLACTSIKAKRLFFYFSKQHRGRGARRLKPEEFDLGSGKRQIVAGGVYDPEFQITVARRRGG